MQETPRNRATQKIVGVFITVGIFIFLTVKGQEVPEFIQWLMVLGVGSLIVGTDAIIDIIRNFKGLPPTPKNDD